MLHDGERTYTWNTADQLIHVSSAQGAEVENQFDANGIRRIRSEKTAEGSTSKVLFISPWSEVRDGELVRYIVHAGRRIVRLAEDNGLAASAIRARADNPRPLLLPLLLSAKTGTLPVLLALAIALLWQLRRVLQRTVRALTPLAALAIAAACAGSDDDPHSVDASATIDLEGSVHTLTEADTLLINDPLGSLLAETNGRGEVQGRFSAYPYGVTREDTSRETRRYTGATRDTTIGLDLMGARFYAPDLGVWTSGDPVAINTPEQSATEQFGTANPYAYANLNPTTATDPDGEFWHIAIGAGIGALVGGGVEAAKQYYATGHIEDWGRVAAAAGGGAVSGAITAAVPTAGVTTFLAANGGSSVAGGLTQRLIASGGKDAGTLTDVVVDATVGVATAGVFRGAGALIKRATAARAPAAQVKALDSEGVVQRQYGELGRGNPIAAANRYAPKDFAQGQLERHFNKHASEWGAGNITQAGYLKRARDLLGRDIGGDILGQVRAEGGDILRYNARTNEFAVGAADGTIRTMFRPKEGIAYWLKQVGE
jgi:RHS repeat-associated protein